MKLTLAKSQSILEYICVSVVFATVGIGTFIAVHETAMRTRMGTQATYGSTDTEMGSVLFADNELQPQDYTYPTAWGQQADKADNYDGMVPAGQIATPDREVGYTVGQSWQEFHQIYQEGYEPEE